MDQAIAACGGDVRATIRALIVANEYLENEVAELMKAVSHAYARGRFQSLFGLTTGRPKILIPLPRFGFAVPQALRKPAPKRKPRRACSREF